MVDSAYLLRDLLKDVSRSFYLTLRFLPASIRPQISLAYLLARATDTVADTEIVSLQDRLASLWMLRERILGQSANALALNSDSSASVSERILLERINDVLAVLQSFAPPDQGRIRDVLATIVSGQELDLIRFGNANPQNMVALVDAQELDDYTYRVAGCVGEFWTKMCVAHVFAANDESKLLAEGVRFGKGLQLVNVLRDLPRDLYIGRCYLPASELSQNGLKPTDLLEPESEQRFRPVFDRWIDIAHQHLSAGWRYTNSIPHGQMRLRLACSWPILIGKATLDALRNGKILDPSHRIKVSRREVRQIIARSVYLYPFASRWARQFH